MKLARILYIVLFVLTANMVLYSQCADILQFGVFNTETTHIYHSQFHEVRQKIQESQSYSDFQNRKLGLTVPIEGVPINGNYASQNWQRWRRDFLNMRYEQVMQITQFSQNIQTASPQIVQAWTTCMATPGFKAWIVYNSTNPERFMLGLKYKEDPFGNRKKVQFRNITFTPAVQTSNQIPKNLEIGEEGIFFTCTRSRKEEVIMIELNILEGASSISLKVKPYVEIPNFQPSQSKILGVGTDFKLYTRETIAHAWVAAPARDGLIKNVTIMQDGTILGVGMGGKLWTKRRLDTTWQEPVNVHGKVDDVAVMQDGTILGVGIYGKLWTRVNLASNWVVVPNKHGIVRRIAIMHNGTIVGVGEYGQLWTRVTLDSDWQVTPKASIRIGGIAVMRDRTLLGTGYNSQLYTRESLDHPWVAAPTGRAVIGITVIPD